MSTLRERLCYKMKLAWSLPEAQQIIEAWEGNKHE